MEGSQPSGPASSEATTRLGSSAVFCETGAVNAAATNKVFTLQEPSRFLNVMAACRGSIDLSDVSLAEMWSLTAMAARARADGRDPVALEWEQSSAAFGFATAVGLAEVVQGVHGRVQGEEGRTVRLTRVCEEKEIQPVAFEIGRLLAGEKPANEASRLAIEYVIIELLRNVVQHSEDVLGGVVGAQRNDRGLHANRPVFQVSVADNGQGIRATMSRTHPDLIEDDVALEQALWPYHSGAFAPGRSGGVENAGLGLFYISELAKALEGRLLVSSGSASLLIDPGLTTRIERLAVGYPGTLVAFEIPTELPEGFASVFERIGEMASERSPRRLTREWLSYEAPPAGAKRFVVAPFLENNDMAQHLAQQQLIPSLVKKEAVVLDFSNVRVITQSFAHALLFEALRCAWASQTRLYVANAQSVVRSALRHVEMYAQGG